MPKIFKSVFTREPIIKVILQKDEYVNFNMVQQVNTFNNKLILKIQKIDRNNKRLLLFPQNKIKLSEYITKGVDRLSFFQILSQTVETVKKLELCELQLKNIKLDIEHTFINPATLEVSFIYLPIVSTDITPINVVEFIKTIIFNSVYSNTGSSNFVENTIKFVNEHTRFSVDDYQKYIDENIVPNNGIKDHTSNAAQLEKKADIYHKYNYDEKIDNSSVKSDAIKSIYSNKEDYAGATTVLDDTVDLKNYLQPEKQTLVWLTRLSTNEKISVDKSEFIVGKNPDSADYAVNNTAVSRNHAKITTDGDKVYITDMNSTNRTFVNGQMILPEQAVELNSDDTIKLANELFKIEIER